MKYYVYNEDKQHGTVEFPIEYYFIDKKHPQYVMPPHWHEEFEIIRVLAGELSVFLNSESFKLRCGDILFVTGGTLHRATPEGAIYECVVFDLSMLKKRTANPIGKYVNPLTTGEVCVKNPFASKESSIYRSCAELLDFISTSKEFHELKIYSILYDLIFELYNSDALTKSKSRKENKKINTTLKLLTCVEENFNDSLTLDRLSELTGFNKKYICRIFKEYTTRSVTDYVNDLKIDLAKHELFYTENSITKVAYDSGFNDSGYFTKIFKRYVGLTPSEYRKQAYIDNKS